MSFLNQYFLPTTMKPCQPLLPVYAQVKMKPYLELLLKVLPEIQSPKPVPSLLEQAATELLVSICKSQAELLLPPLP